MLKAIFIALFFSCIMLVPHPSSADKPHFIFSTDISTGLVDTNGVLSLYLPPYSATSMMHNPLYVPADIDDGLALMLAINLSKKMPMKILSVIPTFGNASMPAEVQVAKFITRALKNKPNIAVTPGALAPAGPFYNPAPRWYNSHPIDTEKAFKEACTNLGVLQMKHDILHSKAPVTILAIGPLTDPACLLVNFPEVKRNLKDIIVLGSNLEKHSYKLNGALANDFNIKNDPFAAAVFLKNSVGVHVTLFPFSLTKTTSAGKSAMSFNKKSLHGPKKKTARSTKSLEFIFNSNRKRQQYWRKIFHKDEGPFDQYTLMYALFPHLFHCKQGKAYMQACGYPSWSPQYKTNVEAYNSNGNGCVPVSRTNYSATAAQLIVSLNNKDNRPLVRSSQPGITSNLPAYKKVASRSVTVCTSFRSHQAHEIFEHNHRNVFSW